MAPLRFGLVLGAFSDEIPGQKELGDFARRAEAVGFDSVQVGDHVQWRAPILESTTVMATFAAVTDRIKIASDIIILPLRDPVLMAKTMASLDVVSGGRMIFGIGVGGDYPLEFAAMRIPVGERGARANESLDIIKGLWANERFSYEGRHFSIRDVEILPRPIQPSLPIWVGGSSDAALRRAARYGDGWIPAFSSASKFARLSSELRRLLQEGGRTAEAFTFGVYLFANVDPDPGRALEAAAGYIERVYQLDGVRTMERSGVTGPPEGCAGRIIPYVEAGADHVVLAPMSSSRDWPRQIDGYAEVIEHVRRRAGGR